MFADVTVIVNGAVEESPTFTDEALLTDYLYELEINAKSHGYPTEVFILYHQHYLDGEECSCAQYLTDHKPACSWNTEPHERTAKDDVVSALDNLRQVMTEYVNTPHGHYTREWVDVATMRAHFGYPTFHQFRAWQWRRDENGAVWFAMYH